LQSTVERVESKERYINSTFSNLVRVPLTPIAGSGVRVTLSTLRAKSLSP
jgi:hypothetical protein